MLKLAVLQELRLWVLPVFGAVGEPDEVGSGQRRFLEKLARECAHCRIDDGRGAGGLWRGDGIDRHGHWLWCDGG